ncbi:hypothetical protein [Prauserella flavalba]|uniref:hypothetical protein n=1 Tax=Prauserella flavalba TaxID=1477506 RepID=UPI0036E9A30D
MSTGSLPSEDQVRAAAEELLAAHREGGAYPTVTALAKQFDLNRTTFYRHFAAAAEAMLDAARMSWSATSTWWCTRRWRTWLSTPIPTAATEL